MYRLFVAPNQIDVDTGTARITGQDHVHLARVLRARVGQQIVLLDGLGSAYLATFTALDKHVSGAQIVERIETPPEPAIRVHVAQALGKGDKFEQVIQHGTEAGASSFVAIQAERSVVEIPAGRAAERVVRWQAIAKGAAEQSGRAIVPKVQPPSKLDDVVCAAESAGVLALLLHTGRTAVPLYTLLPDLETPPAEVTLLVGPEGGWSAKELALAIAHGCKPMSLGPHVLRTETAALVAISQLIYHFARPQEFTPCES